MWVKKKESFNYSQTREEEEEERKESVEKSSLQALTYDMYANSKQLWEW